jgi:hypothetical protein
MSLGLDHSEASPSVQQKDHLRAKRVSENELHAFFSHARSCGTEMRLSVRYSVASSVTAMNWSTSVSRKTCFVPLVGQVISSSATFAGLPGSAWRVDDCRASLLRPGEPKGQN